MTERLIRALGTLGEPSQRLGDVPVRARSSVFTRLTARLFGRAPAPTPTLTDIVVCPMRSDDFRAGVIDFGDGPAASLCTAHGHRIWWLHVSPAASGRGPELIEILAGGRSVRQIELDLGHLAPDARHRA